MKMIRFLISSLVLVMSTLIRGQEAELPCASCLDGTVPCDLPCTSGSRTMMWVSIRRFNASLVQDWFTCQCQNGKTGFSPSYHSINTDAEDFTVTSDGGYNEGGARTFTTRNSTDALVGVSCPADTGLYCEIRSSSDLAWPSSGVISHWGPLFCALNDTDSEMRERILSKNGTIDFPAGTDTENLLPISVDVARTEGAVQVYRAASQKGYLSHFADLDIDLGGTSFVSGQSCYADCGNDLQDYSAGLGECVPAPPPMPRPDPQVPCEPCELDATCVLPCTSDARSLLWISIRRPNPFSVQDWFTCQCQDGNAAFTPGYNSIHTDVEDIRVTSDGGFNSGGARKFSTRNNDALVGLSCPANTGLYCEIRGWSDLAWPSSGIISNSGPLYCSLDIDSELRERVSNGSLDFPAGPDTENLLPASVATGQTEGMMSLFRAGSQQGYASHFADSDIDVGATSFVSGKNCPVECEAKLKQYAEGMGECFQTPPPMSPSTPSPTRGPTPQQPAPTASPITPNPSNLITANPVPQPTTQQPSSTAIGAIPQPPYQQPTTEQPSIEQPTTATRSVAARSMARGATSLAAITLCTLQVIY